MDHRTTFNRLIESTKTLDQDLEPASTVDAVWALLDFARSREVLHIEAAWRLSSKLERELEAEAGFRPPAGWASLAALLAGTSYLEANRDGFVLAEPLSPAEVDDRQLQVALVEAFTRKLVPPATAASIFIAEGIHPAWGLRLAWEVQHGDRAQAGAARPPMGEVLPARQLEAVRKAVFVFVTLIIGALKRLELMKSYPVDALGDVLEEALLFARSVGQCNAESYPADGLDIFIAEGTSNHRVMQVLARDLLDEVFIPAGVIRDVGDARFAVVSDVLGDIRVDKMGVDEHKEWLEAFLKPDGTSAACAIGSRG